MGVRPHQGRRPEDGTRDRGPIPRRRPGAGRRGFRVDDHEVRLLLASLEGGDHRQKPLAVGRRPSGETAGNWIRPGRRGGSSIVPAAEGGTKATRALSCLRVPGPSHVDGAPVVGKSEGHRAGERVGEHRFADHARRNRESELLHRLLGVCHERPAPGGGPPLQSGLADRCPLVTELQPWYSARHESYSQNVLNRWYLR